MKNLKYILLGLITTFASCDKKFQNPNNPTEEVIFSSKKGLEALAIGLNQYYSTIALRQVIEAPGITTRELGVTNTFLNINELARGGTSLPPESGGITNPWVTLLRAKGMAESIIDNVDNVQLADNTRSGFIAYANLYKAMILGHLIQMYEQVPIVNGDNATFSDRNAVVTECINLLSEARQELQANPVSSDFKSNVLGDNVNLSKTVNAFLSRYSLMIGNYANAISFADDVLNDNSQPENSYFSYDANNVNPIWNRTVNSADLDPQANLGLKGDFVPEDDDGRVDFYLGDDKGFALEEAGGQPLVEMRGFFSTPTSPIPMYLPGEMMLNKAEAYARQDNLSQAVTQLNLVRTKTDDPMGVNADLDEWEGDENDSDAVMDEIYKNRAIELFLTGMRFEDHKRFYPDFLSPVGMDTEIERNRNFYPYPFVERENNTNTPPNPEI